MELCPLTGKPCSKKKTHHIIDIKQNKAERTIDVCEDCAKIYIEKAENIQGVNKNSPKAVYAQKLLNYFQDIIDAYAAKKHKVSEGKKCPKCGTSITTIYKTGKLGCDNCYEMFSLDNILMQLHGATQHVGKVPKKWQMQQNLQKQTYQLQNIEKDAEEKLKTAVANEQYEIAAQIKKYLKELTTKRKEIEFWGNKIKEASEKLDVPLVEQLQKDLQTVLNQCFEIQKSMIKLIDF